MVPHGQAPFLIFVHFFPSEQLQRVLSGDERSKLELALKEREAEKSLKMVSRDLDLSDDDDENQGDDENPLASKLNPFGKELKQILAKKPSVGSVASSASVAATKPALMGKIRRAMFHQIDQHLDVD